VTRPGTVLLSASDVTQCVSFGEVIRIVEEVFRAHGLGRVSMPPKVALDVARFGNPNWFHAMLSYAPDVDACGIKWAGGALDNPTRGLPYIVSTLVLSDPATAATLAVMDGTALTAMRTGAAAAVAVRHLAVPGPLRIAIIGAGSLGRSCILAIREVRELQAIHVFDAAPGAAQRLAEAAPQEVSIATSAAAAVENADVVVTATTAYTPLFPAAATKPGVLVVALGSNSELDDELVLSADKLVVDSVEQNVARGQFGPLILAGTLRRERLHAELGDIVAGKKTGRGSRSERIIAGLIGMSTEDIAVAAHVWKAASRLGIGERFSFLA
jgi:ornithine cyclodeaminase/alanine dehydrogenase-like protein (mu-crystallin family)